MNEYKNSDNILSILEGYSFDSSDDIARQVADIFASVEAKKISPVNALPSYREFHWQQ